MKFTNTFSGLCALALLSACGGSEGERGGSTQTAAAPAAIDLSDTSAISVRDNTVVEGLAGQTIGGACKVLERASPNQTTVVMIGAGPVTPTKVPAGENVDFFDSNGERMFGVEAIGPITVVTASSDEFLLNCGS